MKPGKEKYRGREAVVTGGLFHVNDSPLLNAWKKQFYHLRTSKNHWLATKIELVYGH